MSIVLEVTYSDHQVGHFHADEGWRIDAALRMLVIGHGVPRKLVPLDNVQVIDLVAPRPTPAADPDATPDEREGQR